MVKVLELFSTDRRLLETRGSLIIRQLCLHLNAERIFRAIADILEKDDDLEFASMMVVKLNMILITSPELNDFRRRLKNLDSRDGQMLFSSLYRSWCHNAVAAFSLCLLAQAYEHASNLLQIFADLELTVPLLVQIDKLVMLLESPVFTYLRLQLLEPDKYPWLPKCLFGLLMILPQSTAFISLRARLQVVHSSGYVPTTIKPSTSSTFGTARSKIGKEEIKWQELLSQPP
ncbi:vacuole morphology and inheritance protein 14 [Cryptococcus neoformans A1-35-8]|nr:vacuole morphology and inheritance protein 14 [Cryptococcus neoformans var. grubii A5-35-17]OXH00439.1 vacuole morphology and inheritance protein 14 [Cryptococcus neoformans var. grubii A1-35-8]